MIHFILEPREFSSQKVCPTSLFIITAMVRFKNIISIGETVSYKLENKDSCLVLIAVSSRIYLNKHTL